MAFVSLGMLELIHSFNIKSEQSILKSEITRITNCFVSDYTVSKTFNPSKSEENFYGFSDLINTGKIVVLNMNISQYKNLYNCNILKT